MNVTGGNRILIAAKKLVNKAHTFEGYLPEGEEYTTNFSMSNSTIFAQSVPVLPISFNSLSSAYDTNGVVERLRFEIDVIEHTTVGVNKSQGWKIKLPASYSVSGYSHNFESGDYLCESIGKLQLVPPVLGSLLSNGKTEYNARLYKSDGTADVVGSGTEIDDLDPINWYIDYYNGIIHIQDPSDNFDTLHYPAYVDAFLYVGAYMDEVGQTGTSLKDGISSHSYMKLQSDSFTLSSASTMDVNISFSSINAKSNDIIVDLPDITGSVTNWFVNLPNLQDQANQEGKRVNVIVKDFNPSSTSYNLYLKSPWQSSGSTNRILSVNMNTIVSTQGHYVRMEPLETLSLLYDGNDWIVTNQNKMSYIDFQANDPITEANTAYLSR